MTHRFPPRPRRGFTLIEMVIVLAVLSILGGVTFVGISRMKQSRGLMTAARSLVGQIQKVRSVAAMRRVRDTTGVNASAIDRLDDDPTARSFRQTGVFVRDAQTLELFGDFDGIRDGNEEILGVIELDARYPDSQITVTNPPAGSEMRFLRNRTRALTSPGQIALQDATTGLSATIIVTVAGSPVIQ